MENSTQQIQNSSMVSSTSPTYFQLPFIPIKIDENKKQSVKIVMQKQDQYLDNQMVVQSNSIKEAFNRKYKQRLILDNIGYTPKNKYDEFSTMLPSIQNDFLSRRSGKLQKAGFYQTFLKSYRNNEFLKQNNICYQYADQHAPAQRPVLSYRVKKLLIKQDSSLAENSKLIDLCQSQVKMKKMFRVDIKKEKSNTPSPQKSIETKQLLSQRELPSCDESEMKQEKKKPYLIEAYEDLQKSSRSPSPLLQRTFTTKYERFFSPHPQPYKPLDEKNKIKQDIKIFEDSTLRRGDKHLQRSNKGKFFYKTMRDYGDRALKSKN